MTQEKTKEHEGNSDNNSLLQLLDLWQKNGYSTESEEELEVLTTTTLLKLTRILRKVFDNCLQVLKPCQRTKKAVEHEAE